MRGALGEAHAWQGSWPGCGWHGACCRGASWPFAPFRPYSAVRVEPGQRCCLGAGRPEQPACTACTRFDTAGSLNTAGPEDGERGEPCSVPLSQRLQLICQPRFVCTLTSWARRARSRTDSSGTTYMLAQVKLVQDWVVSRVICALAQVNTDRLRDAGQTVSWVAGAGFTCREAAAAKGTKRSQNPRSIPDLAA